MDWCEFSAEERLRFFQSSFNNMQEGVILMNVVSPGYVGQLFKSFSVQILFRNVSVFCFRKSRLYVIEIALHMVPS